MRKILRRLAVAAMIASAFAGLAYAGNVTGSVNFNANFSQLINAGVVQPYSIPAQIAQTNGYANGTGSNQVDTVYAKQLTLAASAQTLDLTSLTDPAGNAINFARVRVLVVQNTATAAGYDCKVESGASNGVSWLPPSSSPLYARYGGVLYVADPASTGAGNGNVIGGSSKTITLDPGANTITVNVLIVGGSGAFVLIIPFGLRRYRRLRAA